MSIEFYKEFGENGYLANYSNHGFIKNGVFYKTVEHYYQSEKFDDITLKNKIISCDSPKEASTIGRDRSNVRKDNFNKIKDKVMYEGILEKFRQNKDIKCKLIETRNQDIVENTIDEYYWGIGKDKSGKNTIGKILVKVRETLKKELIESILSKCNNRVYILGHKCPDADSIFSAYILNNILNKLGYDSKFAIYQDDNYADSDKKIILDYLPAKPDKIDLLNKKFIFVDHNNCDGIDKNNILGAIDHHIITNELDDVLEIEYASTGLLIYDLFKDIYNFSTEEKKLILLTVLTDTDYLCSSRFGAEDQKLYNDINKNINLDAEFFKEKFFNATDFSLSVSENIIKNNKYYSNLNLYRILISSMELDDEKIFNKYYSYIKDKYDNFLLIWANYKYLKTKICYNNKYFELDYILTSTFKSLEYFHEDN